MDNLTKEFMKQVKSSRKYNTISDEIVLREIRDYLIKNPIKEITKQDIKKIRNQLHLSYASFQTKKKKKIKDYLSELRQNPNDISITDKLLSVTLSTKERLDNYREIYTKIFQITGKPKTITDLGCGFNPFSYPFMGLKELTYYAYDINEQDIDCLNEYFKIMGQRGLKGGAGILDLRDLRQISKLPFTHIIFLWKIIDIIDINNHKPGESLIKQLTSKTKFIAASFATKTITGKQMNFPERKWFELMLKRNNLAFKTLKTNNEIFYVIISR